MKKIVSLILAVMMIASLTVTAFAADNNAKITQNNPTSKYFAKEKEGSVNTELWLQVEAKGQIDVTVPLVLVFKTDIDGGSATAPSTYGITNRSTADLAVTKIAVKTEAKVDESTVNPMELVAYSVVPTEDQYKVQLSVTDSGETGEAANKNFDLYTASHTKEAINGGLFELAKAPKNDTADDGTFTKITADMATGSLSFVTKYNGEDLNTDKGVKLLTVTYTVAVDTSDGIGADITTNSEVFPGNP